MYACLERGGHSIPFYVGRRAHLTVPNWLTSGTWTNSTLLAAITEHIQGLGGHYKGQLYGACFNGSFGTAALCLRTRLIDPLIPSQCGTW